MDTSFDSISESQTPRDNCLSEHNGRLGMWRAGVFEVVTNFTFTVCGFVSSNTSSPNGCPPKGFLFKLVSDNGQNEENTEVDT